MIDVILKLIEWKGREGKLELFKINEFLDD